MAFPIKQLVLAQATSKQQMENAMLYFARMGIFTWSSINDVVYAYGFISSIKEGLHDMQIISADVMHPQQFHKWYKEHRGLHGLP